MSDRPSKSGKTSLVAGMRIGIDLLTPRERRAGVLLAFSMAINGLLQTSVLLAVVPLVQAMIDPASSMSGRAIQWLRGLTNASNDETFLVYFAVAVLVLIAVKAVFGWLQIGWISRFSAGCEKRLTVAMLERTLRGPYAWLVAQNSARLREVVFGHVVHWSRDFVRTLMQFVNDAFFITLLLGALIWASGWAGIVTALVFVLCASAVFAAVRPKQTQLAETKRQALITAHVVITETLRGIKDVKMAGAETEFANLFGRYVSIYADDDAKGQQWRQLPRLLLEVVAFGAIVGVGLAVVLLGARGGDTAGVLVLFGLAAIRLLPMVNTVLQSLGTLVAALPLLQELDDVAKATSTGEISKGVSVELGHWHNVTLGDVSYRYQNEGKLALDRVSLTLKRGRSHGVVGLSGAGKSTLIDILTGLIQPSDGVMTVDGHALSAQQQLNWRRQFGCVIQHPMLLDASLKDNIVFGAGREADRERLDRSIALAKLDGVTARLSGGVEAGIGEQGSGLSGGERQRVAIARALYRGADILILDEATSSLDPLVEREIAESVASLHGQVTTIIVSHRLGLVRDCDEIWVMEGAKIVDRGSHAHLMEHCDLYRRMVGVQRGTGGLDVTTDENNDEELRDELPALAQAVR